MPKRLSQNEFENKIKETFNDEYIVLTEYEGNRNNIKLFHKTCGTEFFIKAGNLFDKRNSNEYEPCPVCTKTIGQKIDPALYRKRIFNMTKGELIPIGDYIDDKTEILYMHIKCGMKYKRKPNIIKTMIDRNVNTYSCPLCGKTHGMSEEDFINVFNHVSKGKYSLLSRFIDDYHKITIQHNECGNIYEIRPSLFTRRQHQCSACVGGVAYTIDEVREKIDNARDKRFKLMSDNYINKHTPLDILDTKCGKTFTRSYAQFFPSCKCLHCEYDSSAGEAIIKDYLTNKNIEFDIEKTFDDLKNINFLRYDFFVESLNLLIEFDGIQHFREVEFFNSTLDERRNNDILKNEYALLHGLNLLRIPYILINDIKDILDSYIDNNEAYKNIYLSDSNGNIINGKNYFKIQ